MSDTNAVHDAVILGGGLAGLCLALQLRGEFPDLDVVVLDRQQHPLATAAHKVGESTVDIGAHYFRETLGLRDYLHREHIFKFGLRYFFSDGCHDIGRVTELGLSEAFPAPSYQLDRGLFETFLGEEARRRGVDLHTGTVVRQLDVGQDGAPHAVRYTDAGGRQRSLQARWLLDASGRAALLRRRFGLTRDDGHHANAAWFRIDARLEIDAWCKEDAWRTRCRPPERWRSTSHLCGPGYWVWLIPLASGAHSVGIVADAAMHPLDGFRDFEGALEWLALHQPQVAREVARHRDRLLDFRFLRDYSHGCRQVFSADRWALTGEAGAFLDPLYSSGSDFITLANTFICELVRADREGRSLPSRVRQSERLFQSFYDSMLALFRGQYPLFGNAAVMACKVVWDQAFYWGVLCQLVFQRRLADTALFAELGPALMEVQLLNERVQALFRDWHATAPTERPAEMLDQRRLKWFRELNEGMHVALDDAGVRTRLKANLALLREVAGAIAALAARDGASIEGLPICTGIAPALFDLAPAGDRASVA